ncbi:MAG: LegC family aminotransferase [Demequinaceae bacterium]|nr:LegC family aminotransferase [Demequinaceae bacterium]
MPVDPRAVITAIRSVVGDAPNVPLHAPDIGALERQYVDECLESTFVSSVGAFVDRFEQEIAAFTGAARAVAVSNGTVALQIALSLAGVRPGDEVVVPALSFIATVNAVAHVGAHPVFVDSEPESLGMSPTAVADLLAGTQRKDDSVVNPVTGRRIAAIVPMHTLGHPMRIAELVAIADEYEIPVVEDAAESLGSFVGDRHTGTISRLGILSFNGNKIVTTGGGGMILTEDAEFGRRAKHLTTTAKLPHAWEFEHDEVGFNYRLPNLNAALGVAQVERLGEFLKDKRLVAERYAAAFSGLDGVEFLAEPPGTSSNYWLCAIRIDGGLRERDEILQAVNDDGLRCRPLWNLLNAQAPYREAPTGPLPVATALHASVICVPSSAALAAV